MSSFTVHTLLETPLITVRDVCCAGTCRHAGPEEQAATTQLVFPYRGTYVRHVGREVAVADANQVLFFNAGDAYRVSHPIAGGDASLVLEVDEALLREVAPKALLKDGSNRDGGNRDGARLAFRWPRLRIDPRAQVLVALLRHSLQEGIADALEGESIALTLAQRALGPRTAHAAGATRARQRLADRAKLVLTADLARRWTLAEIAAEVGCSPVYLTQVFRQVEGVPLYRYQLRLRLARALDLLGDYDDLTELGLELGFSSHSHFSAAFREMYGRTPSEFRQSALQR
jgi:AraC-like DNA-binding protein